VSVISRLILEKIYELFVGENETVRNIGVSVEQGSTVQLKDNVFQKKMNAVRGSNLPTCAGTQKFYSQKKL